jgi:hypothetical protein
LKTDKKLWENKSKQEQQNDVPAKNMEDWSERFSCCQIKFLFFYFLVQKD